MMLPMISRLSRWLGTSGAVAVELAMVTPVMVTLVLGGVDFGNLFVSGQSIAAATRVGAEFARNSPTCQNSATGIQILPNPLIGGACIAGIQTAMQSSRNFSPALTFPDGVRLECYCDSDNQRCSNAAWMPANFSCADPAVNRGQNQIFIRVTARQNPIPAPLFPWPGFPVQLNGATTLQIQ
jgi:hypothetical protein